MVMVTLGERVMVVAPAARPGPRGEEGFRLARGNGRRSGAVVAQCASDAYGWNVRAGRAVTS